MLKIKPGHGFGKNFIKLLLIRFLSCNAKWLLQKKQIGLLAIRSAFSYLEEMTSNIYGDWPQDKEGQY